MIRLIAAEEWKECTEEDVSIADAYFSAIRPWPYLNANMKEVVKWVLQYKIC